MALNLNLLFNDYTGIGKLQRIKYIISKNKKLPIEYVPIIIEELKKDSIIEKDMKWFTTTNLNANSKLEKLENDLLVHKKSMDRSTLLEIGDFLAARGDYNGAIQRYFDTEEHASTVLDNIELCAKLSKVFLYLHKFDSAKHQASIALRNAEIIQFPKYLNFLNAVFGIAYLNSGHFKQAVDYFLLVQDIDKDFYDIITMNDVGTYACLASFNLSMNEIKTKIFDNSDAKTVADKAPELINILSDYISLKFSNCIRQLDAVEKLRNYDIYFSQHIRDTLKKFRESCYIQYFSPFSAIKLESMAQYFGVNVNDLEREVTSLIIQDVLDARIDSVDKIMYSRDQELRQKTFKNALDAGSSISSTVRCMTMRTLLQKNNLIVEGLQNVQSQSKAKSSKPSNNNSDFSFLKGLTGYFS